MKYVLLTDDDGGILVACPDEAAAESLGAAAIFNDGGVSAWLVPARAIGWDYERVKEILAAGGSLADVEDANLEMVPRQVDSDLTEDEAITEGQRLRGRFDWSGTMFVRQDVIDNVRAAWRHAHDEAYDENEYDSRPESLSAEREKELVDAVMDTYAYRKLADRFAELGNELLYDAAQSAINTTDGSGA